MNYTYVYNSFKPADVIFADFYNELWAIIILCVLILTRGVVTSILKCIKLEEVHNHVHYSTELSRGDLRLDIEPKSDFDPYEGFRPPHNSPKQKKPAAPKPNPPKPKPPPHVIV